MPIYKYTTQEELNAIPWVILIMILFILIAK